MRIFTMTPDGFTEALLRSAVTSLVCTYETGKSPQA